MPAPPPTPPDNITPTNSESVVVAVRKRPLSSKEIEDGRLSIVEIDENMITITEPDDRLRADRGRGGPMGGPTSRSSKHSRGAPRPPKSYTFDIVIDEGHEQRALYDEIAYPLVESVIQGYNGTIFAYGQTGTGKTFTMAGDGDGKNQGIIPNSFDHIFEAVAVGLDGDENDSNKSDEEDEEEDEEEDDEEEDEEEEDDDKRKKDKKKEKKSDKEKSKKKEKTTKKFLVQASYLEIYNEDVRDLLSSSSSSSSSSTTTAVTNTGIDPSRLRLKEHPERGVYVEGLTTIDVHDVASVRRILDRGTERRTTASTWMNDGSSRSHSIFTLRIETSEITADGQESFRYVSFFLRMMFFFFFFLLLLFDLFLIKPMTLCLFADFPFLFLFISFLFS